MKRLLIVTSLCLSFFVIGASGQQPDGPLTNAAVVRLVKAGFKEKTIITIINNRPGDFKLDTEHLIELKRNGVNENIILAMLSSQMGTVLVDDDEWTSESLFKDMRKSERPRVESAGGEKHLRIGIEFPIVDPFARRIRRGSERREREWISHRADHQATNRGWGECGAEAREDADADQRRRH